MDKASAFERPFSSSALNREGSTEMRMRGSRVVFETANGLPEGRVDSAVIQHYGRDSLIDWIGRALAEGKTVILHPDTSPSSVSSANPTDLEES
jgi:hypothetical protein